MRIFIQEGRSTVASKVGQRLNKNESGCKWLIFYSMIKLKNSFYLNIKSLIKSDLVVKLTGDPIIKPNSIINLSSSQ